VPETSLLSTASPFIEGSAPMNVPVFAVVVFDIVVFLRHGKDKDEGKSRPWLGYGSQVHPEALLSRSTGLGLVSQTPLKIHKPQTIRKRRENHALVHREPVSALIQ